MKPLLSLTLTGASLLLGAHLSSAATVYGGNGNSGFGGEIGLSSLSVDDDGSTVTATLTKGGDGMFDTLVFYIDSTVGGFADTSTLEDDADELRRGISGFDFGTSATVVFPTGFAADYGIAINVNTSTFGGLWSLVAGGDFSLPFVDTVNISPNNDPNASSFTFSFDLSEIGISTGDSFDFVATYGNANGPFRSDEAIGDGVAAGNPGTNTITFTGGRTYTSTPEPTVGLLGALAGLCLLRRRR